MENESKKEKNVEDIFAQVGEFGPYQLVMFVLISITSLGICVVGFGYSIYGAVPSHR
jgi:hypothetical protein